MLFRSALPATAALLLCACTAQRGAPTVAPPPPSTPARVPPGCEKNLSGEWIHAQSPSWRYEATDDGSLLRMTVHAPPADGAEGTLLELQRTPEGFHGFAEALVGTPGGGPPCRVRFATEIAACEGDTLLVRSVATSSVDARCRMPPSPTPSPRLEHLLRRVLPAADAGAGTR
ncbi:MAG: hypothetical protein RL653_2136 [Pseudomonadota bacterium]